MRSSKLPRWALALCAAPLSPILGAAQTLAPVPQPAQSTPADGSPVMPDRGPGPRSTAPMLQVGGLSLGESGASYRSDSSGARLQWRLGAGSGLGAQLGVDYAKLIGDQWALGANAQAGSRQQELMLNGLYSPASNLHLGLSLGWLRSSDTYQFHSGPDQVKVGQYSALLRVVRQFETGSTLSQVSASAYRAHAIKPDVPERAMTEETPTLLRFLVDPREISPGRLQGFAVGLGMHPFPDAELKFSLGRERLAYRFFDDSQSDESRTTASLDYVHALPGCWQLEGGLSSGVASNRMNFGVKKGIWSVGLSRDAGRLGMGNQTRVVAGMDVPLDGSVARCTTMGARRSAPMKRLDEVFQRPRELPMRVLARVDLTARPELLASLDKAALGGAKVTATADTLSIVLAEGATAIAEMRINGSVVSNLGSDGQPLVWVQGNALIVGVRRLPNLPAGASYMVEAIVLLTDGGISIVAFDVVGN